MPHTVHRRGYLYLTLFTEEGTYNLTLFTEEVTYISQCTQKGAPISHSVHRRGYLYITLFTEDGNYISKCTQGIHLAQRLYRGVSHSLVYICMGNLMKRGGPTAQCKQKGDHSTVKTAHRNQIGFMSFKNIMHLYIMSVLKLYQYQIKVA